MEKLLRDLNLAIEGLITMGNCIVKVTVEDLRKPVRPHIRIQVYKPISGAELNEAAETYEMPF